MLEQDKLSSENKSANGNEHGFYGFDEGDEKRLLPMSELKKVAREILIEILMEGRPPSGESIFSNDGDEKRLLTISQLKEAAREMLIEMLIKGRPPSCEPILLVQDLFEPGFTKTNFLYERGKAGGDESDDYYDYLDDE
jgi:hypothetical protein